MLAKRLSIPIATLAATIALPAIAQPAFTFRNVEFMPSDSRMPAAQTYLAGAAPAGTPMAAAVHRVEDAVARCRTARGGGGMRCEFVTMHHPTGEMMQDIVWTVRLMPGADGGVARSTVTRDIYGV